MAKHKQGLLPFSNKLGKLEADVERYKKEYLQMWWSTSAGFPELGNTYQEAEQKSIEAELFRFIDRTSLKLDDFLLHNPVNFMRISVCRGNLKLEINLVLF